MKSFFSRGLRSRQSETSVGDRRSGRRVLVGLVTLFARFFLDLAQALLDPRIRYDNGTTLR